MSADDQREQRYGVFTLDTLAEQDKARRLGWLDADQTYTFKAEVLRALPDLIAAARERDQLSAKVVRILALHRPIPGDEHAAQRCNGCIAGYYPPTGDLVHCAWPCPTIRALEGQP